MMDSFWIFLEAMAGIVDKGEVVDNLQQGMPERKREKMREYLRLVSGEITRLAAKADGKGS